MRVLPKRWSFVIASLSILTVPGFAAVAISEAVAYGERLVFDAPTRELQPADEASAARASRLREAQLLSIAAAAPAVTTLGTIDDAASCSARLMLVSSVVYKRRPERSLAAVRSARGTRILRLGEKVDALQLIALRPRRAYLRDERGAICELWSQRGATATHARRSAAR